MEIDNKLYRSIQLLIITGGKIITGKQEKLPANFINSYKYKYSFYTENVKSLIYNCDLSSLWDNQNDQITKSCIQKTGNFNVWSIKMAKTCRTCVHVGLKQEKV